MKARELLACSDRHFKSVDVQRRVLGPLLTTRIEPAGKYSRLLAAMLHAQARFLDTRLITALDAPPPAPVKDWLMSKPRKLKKLGDILSKEVLDDICAQRQRTQDAQRAAGLWVCEKDFYFSIRSVGALGRGCVSIFQHPKPGCELADSEKL